jgi:predicted ATPase
LASLVFSSTDSIICIEDPEVHLHPKAQAELMDIIIDYAKKGRQIIITTHSEHMLLRLIRRVVEDYVNPNDVLIYYLSKKKGKVVKERINILKEGKIRPPLRDFFEEEVEDIVRIVGAGWYD